MNARIELLVKDWCTCRARAFCAVREWTISMCRPGFGYRQPHISVDGLAKQFGALEPRGSIRPMVQQETINMARKLSKVYGTVKTAARARVRDQQKIRPAPVDGLGTALFFGKKT